MKKVRFFALMLALMAFALAGCSLNQNLKLRKSTWSAAFFYANTYLNTTPGSVGIEKINIADSSAKRMVNKVLDATKNNDHDILTIVCVMDFHAELSSNSENTEKFKIYEMEDDNFVNLVVKVVKKSSSTFSASLYVTEEPVTKLDSLQAQLEVEVKLIDVIKNNYTIAYKKDGVNNDASFFYDKTKSYMKIDLTLKDGTLVNNIVREIYNYVGDPCAIRTVSTIKVGGVLTLNSIFEILKTPYLLRNKVGELNGAPLRNLSSVKLDEIARKEESEKCGYISVSDARKGGDVISWDTQNHYPYGNFN